jgi:hypothetical protein
MRGILVDENAKIYSEPNSQNLSLATLKKGDEFELGKVTRKNREVWVEITLPSGQTGYIPGETHIFQIKKVQMMNGPIDLRDGPSDTSNVVKTYNKNDVVTAVGIEKDEGKGWIKVTDSEGAFGYLKGDTKIRLYMEPTKSGAIKQMISGGLFTLLGGVFYVTSVTRGDTENTMALLNVAIIAFGLMQVVQGIIQYRQAKKNENEKK